jgi:predicted CXXCH cytochrome family protein
MADVIIRTCDACNEPAMTRVTFQMDKKPERELDLCQGCHDKFIELAKYSRRPTEKRRHRGYSPVTYQDRPQTV